MPSFKSGRKDLLIIGALLLAAAAVWGAYNLIYRTGDKEKMYAEIKKYDNAAVERVSLSKDRTFSVDGLPNVVFEVKEHKIAFILSDCPDQVCVHTGWLDTGGNFAACLPNRVLLWIVDEDEHGVDAVAQ